MSKRLTALLVAALPLSALAVPETYTLDPLHTYPNFSVDHLGLSTVRGHFEKVTGTVTVDRTARTGIVDISIPTATVDTGDQDKGTRARSRDDHLRGADFFNATAFPTMTYKSYRMEFTGGRPSAIDGNLTLLGVTRPVTLTVVRFNCSPASPDAKAKCGGDAVGKFRRSDFGMKAGIPAIGDEVSLAIGFEGTKE